MDTSSGSSVTVCCCGCTPSLLLALLALLTALHEALRGDQWNVDLAADHIPQSRETEERGVEYREVAELTAATVLERAEMSSRPHPISRVWATNSRKNNSTATISMQTVLCWHFLLQPSTPLNLRGLI